MVDKVISLSNELQPDGEGVRRMQSFKITFEGRPAKIPSSQRAQSTSHPGFYIRSTKRQSRLDGQYW